MSEIILMTYEERLKYNKHRFKNKLLLVFVIGIIMSVCMAYFILSLKVGYS